MFFYDPFLTYGYVINPEQDPAQVDKMSFLSSTGKPRLSLRNRKLGVKALLLHIDSSQVRWLKRLIWKSVGCWLIKVSWASPTGKWPMGRFTHWRNWISSLAWKLLSIPGVEECCWRKGYMGFPLGTVISITRPQKSRKDGWKRS